MDDRSIRTNGRGRRKGSGRRLKKLFLKADANSGGGQARIYSLLDAFLRHTSKKGLVAPSLRSVRQFVASIRRWRKPVGFLPTMHVLDPMSATNEAIGRPVSSVQPDHFAPREGLRQS